MRVHAVGGERGVWKSDFRNLVSDWLQWRRDYSRAGFLEENWEGTLEMNAFISDLVWRLIAAS